MGGYIYTWETWDRYYKYRTDYGDYIIPSSSLSELERYIGDTFLAEHAEDRELYETRVKKFDEILYDVLLDFAGSGIKLLHPNSSDIFIENSKSVVEKIMIEGNDKKTSLTYDPETHEISGFVWMPLGDRDLTEITEDEVKIIRRALLIWIYENV